MHTSIANIKEVYNRLGDLKSKVVFVGGATVIFYADKEVADVRPTDDIDVIIEILHYNEYAAIEEQLRSMGFVNDKESAVMCRYIIEGITVDVMPTLEKVLNFSNKWYPEGFTKAIPFKIDKTCTVNILSAPYFIATKLEAFKNRGKNDGRTSEDFEDIVFILENRTILWNELATLQGEIKKYLADEFKSLLANRFIEEWIGCHTESNKNVGYIIEQVKQFAEEKK